MFFSACGTRAAIIFLSIAATSLSSSTMLPDAAPEAPAAQTTIATAPDPEIVSEPDAAAKLPTEEEALPVPAHPLQQRWRSVKTQIELDRRIMEACRDGYAACPPSAEAFVGIIDRASLREGLAQIGEINRAINLALRPATDQALYGVEEYWASPLTTFERGAGDCEDYAIAKYVALRELGYAASSVRLVVVRNETTKENHAVVWVKNNGRWLVLDNQRLLMAESTQLASLMTPLHFIEDDASAQVASYKPPETALTTAH